jgi:hypothetical protein
MENIIAESSNINEYSFRRGKQFSFLTLRTLNTKLSINSISLAIEMERYYLGFIKGKKTTINVPINNITSLDEKTLLSFSDLLVAGVFLLAGIFLNPLFYIIIPISVWACINTNIVISTNSDKDIKIPSFSKKDAKEFVQYFKDIYIEA